ncbi:GPCR kinase [Parasponia andersonii]|uniref:non-specific serine/threonine protein kinase n=1 Tax=Parasponia andersonii TaxID=3476 RepID=A0A2P5BWE0_PARAD|nr:GPCR kinase [Parasponia andersonii]
MHPIVLPPTTTVFLIVFFFFYYVDSVSSSLTNCNQAFDCGQFRNITYPFTGGDRPDRCGPPEFRLACVNDSPELTINSVNYRVLGLDPVLQTLSLARLDLWNETCPGEFVNTTLDSGIFSSGAGNTDLTMFYKCNTSRLTVKPENQFKCENYGSSFSDSYFLVGPIPLDPILAILKCGESVEVPILEPMAAKLLQNMSLLGEALMMGFNVNYTNPNADDCSKCLDSGHQCGFDPKSNKSICICGNRDCPVPGSMKRNWVAIGTSVALSGIVIISAVTIFFNRKAFGFWKKEKRSDKLDVELVIRNYGLFAKQYSYANVKKMTNSFAEKIGQGGFGAVFKGRLLDGCLVAVKLLNESKENGEDFINEVASIGRTSHVNIITLLGFCYEKNKRVLIYEYMPNGSLDKFIFNEKSLSTTCRLEWRILFDIATGIARGLEYLHRGCNTRILHFDIKPQNILLDKDFCPKISDFGLAKLWLTKESIISTMGARGTIGYIAPEVFSRSYGGVSHKSDVYSYGMLILEMIGGRKNFDSRVSHTSEIYYPNKIYKDLEQGEEVKVSGVTTEEDVEISRKMALVSFWCIQTNPSVRPSMSKVVEMLEGSLESLKIPPKPFLFSPPRSPQESMTTNALPRTDSACSIFPRSEPTL